MTPTLKLAASVIAVAAIAMGGCGGSTDYSNGTAANPVATDASVSTKSSDVGTILAGDGGKTLYLFEADKSGKPTCTGDCAAAWPPAIESGKVTVSGDAEDAKVGTIAGTGQLTYAGHPLYYYAKDTDAEDVYGNGIDSFGAEWYALTPSGANAEEKSSAGY